MTGLLGLISALGAMYATVSYVISISPWGQLAKHFAVDAKQSLGGGAGLQATPVISRAGSENERHSTVASMISMELTAQGMLFTGHPVGDWLRLNRNFLLPWSAVKLQEGQSGQHLQPALRAAFAGPAWLAIVETADGVFTVHLDRDAFARCVELQRLKR